LIYFKIKNTLKRNYNYTFKYIYIKKEKKHEKKKKKHETRPGSKKSRKTSEQAGFMGVLISCGIDCVRASAFREARSLLIKSLVNKISLPVGVGGFHL